MDMFPSSGGKGTEINYSNKFVKKSYTVSADTDPI